MAIGYHIVRLYAELKTAGFFDGVSAVLELGSQDIVCAERPDDLNALLEAFGVAPADVGRLASRGPAREIFERLGFSYASVDADGKQGALPLDLNVDSVPAHWRQKFDLVTNFGTSEHVANQANCFSFVHDAAAEGAFILHELPFQGWLNHGFFNYQPAFFLDLARANGYELIGQWVNSYPHALHDFVPWELYTWPGKTAADEIGANLLVILRKGLHRPYAHPFQGIYRQASVGEISARYGEGAIARAADQRLIALIRDAVRAIAEEPAMKEAKLDSPWRRVLARVRREGLGWIWPRLRSEWRTPTTRTGRAALALRRRFKAWLGRA
jgi:hypothetical protein